MIPFSGYIKAIGSVLLAVVLAFAFWKTYDFGYRNAQAIGDKNLANYKDTLENAAASSVSAAFADYASGVARGQSAEAKFFVDQHAADSRAAELKEQIDDVAQPHIAAPARAVTAVAASPASPVYRCVFSLGFVRLWNAAAGVTDDPDAALSTGSPSGSVALGSGADQTADSGVSQADILDWLVDFANVKRADEDKLRSIRNLQPDPASQQAPNAAPAQ